MPGMSQPWGLMPGLMGAPAAPSPAPPPPPLPPAPSPPAPADVDDEDGSSSSSEEEDEEKKRKAASSAYNMGLDAKLPRAQALVQLSKARLGQMVENVLGFDSTVMSEFSCLGLCMLLWCVTRVKPATKLLDLRIETYADLCALLSKAKTRIVSVTGTSRFEDTITGFLGLSPTEDKVKSLAESLGYEESFHVIVKAAPKGKAKAKSAPAPAPAPGPAPVPAAAPSPVLPLPRAAPPAVRRVPAANVPVPAANTPAPAVHVPAPSAPVGLPQMTPELLALFQQFAVAAGLAPPTLVPGPAPGSAQAPIQQPDLLPADLFPPAEAPVAEPPVAEPPVAEPPVAELPMAEPPVAEPAVEVVAADASDQMCVICQAPFGRELPLEALPCGHVLHIVCIDSYIAATNRAKSQCCPFKCWLQAAEPVVVADGAEQDAAEAALVIVPSQQEIELAAAAVELAASGMF
jgi:hypothetical protein